jgi:hypothetical protein
MAGGGGVKTTEKKLLRPLFIILLAEKKIHGVLCRDRGAPVQLFEQILVQKEMCNEMLQSKNQLIEMLEAENRVCDENYKELIHSYHVNMSVLAGRMENHVQVSNARKKKFFTDKM